MHGFDEYWVVVPSHAYPNANTIKWGTESEAIEESKRLAEYYPSIIFTVYKAVARVGVKVPVSVEHSQCRTLISQS